jgi:hypothetical protein
MCAGVGVEELQPLDLSLHPGYREKWLVSGHPFGPLHGEGERTIEPRSSMQDASATEVGVPACATLGGAKGSPFP